MWFLQTSSKNINVKFPILHSPCFKSQSISNFIINIITVVLLFDEFSITCNPQWSSGMLSEYMIKTIEDRSCIR